ncbi:MAG: nuclear transport factor 2 family protein [Ferruginibacter sp.]
MKLLLILICWLFSCASFAQNNAEKSILQVLAVQNKAWNDGNLVSFMNSYWTSDSLMFIGKSGVTYGWQNTLDNYRKGYPDTDAMGKLTFDILHIKKLSKQYYSVVGKWLLTRSMGNVGGHFTLIFRKINGKWVIVSDHSS